MKKAIIIGATSGMGKELAKKFADENYNVGITGRRTELLDELKSQKPNLFYTKTFDITDTVFPNACYAFVVLFQPLFIRSFCLSRCIGLVALFNFLVLDCEKV